MKRRAEGEESGCLQQQVPVTKERDANVSVIRQPSRPSGQNSREQAQNTGEKNGDAVVGLTALQRGSSGLRLVRPPRSIGPWA